MDGAADRVQNAPNTYPIYASLLSDLTALMVQQAQSALDRTEDLLAEALRSNPDRKEAEVQKLATKLKEPLISMPKSHAALFGVNDALNVGLPVKEIDMKSEQWQILWRLWTKYWVLSVNSPQKRVYEGRRVSWVLNWPTTP